MSQPGIILDNPPAAHPVPSTMRAAVYRGKGKVVVETLPVPAIAAGEVLIRVAACGICGTDLKKIEYGFVPAPQIFGHEVSGTVVGVGAGVSKWKLGERVMSFHHVPCGTCFYCERRLFSQCPGYKKVGLTAGFDPNGGGFAQYVRALPWVAERGMVAIPDDISFDEASFIEPVNTCIKAVEKARVIAGETAVVMGLGPIGMLLAMLSKLEGANVIGSDPMQERRAKSLSLGVDLAVDPRDGALPAEINSHTEGRGADVVLVAVPIPAALTEALRLIRPGGRVLLFAQNDPLMKIEFPAAAVGVEEKEILGSYSAAIDRASEAGRLIFTHKLPVNQLITHRFSLEDMDRALQLAARPVGNSLKVVIHP
jgi:L-iditol 2-dehydrogenase